MAGLDPETLLRAYAMGVFPMAEARDDTEIFWVDPQRRGIIPLDGFHISRSLARQIRRPDYDIRFDHDFPAVVEACADRQETWINGEIFDLYCQLFARGNAHSAEVWHEGHLIGGVYGVALGGAFFGESMFSRRTGGSKIALSYLIDRVRQAGFRLFDAQFITPHLRSLGAIEISRRDYHQRLARAIGGSASFTAAGPVPSPQVVLQRMTQTS